VSRCFGSEVSCPVLGGDLADRSLMVAQLTAFSGLPWRKLCNGHTGGSCYSTPGRIGQSHGLELANGIRNSSGMAFFLALRRRRRACTMGLGAVDHQRDMLVGAPVLVAGNPNHGIPGHPNNRGVECDITHFMSRKWQKQGVDGQTSRHTEEEDPVTHLAPRPQSSNQVIHLTRHGWRAQPVL
jgi:hypothetical protein